MSADDEAKAWRTLASRHVLQDRWLSLRADTCLTGRGVRVDPYYVLEFPDFAHVIALDDDERVVLVRQYRHGAQELSLELPGGRVDADDPTPLAAIARELLEETGYGAETLEMLVSLSPDPARQNNRIHFALARNARPIQAPSPEPDEDIEIVLMPLEEAIDCALAGGVINASHVGALLIAAARLRPLSSSERQRSRIASDPTLAIGESR